MPYGRTRVPVAERYVVANCNALFILLYMVHFWHGSHRMRQAQCNGTSSVCLSICLSHSPAAAARGGFPAVGTAGGWYGSIAARCVCSRRGCLSIHIHSSTAVSSKCEQCHVYSHSRKLNTDLLISETAITSTQRGPTIQSGDVKIKAAAAAMVMSELVPLLVAVLVLELVSGLWELLGLRTHLSCPFFQLTQSLTTLQRCLQPFSQWTSASV